jgi:sugar/nucleoside kinase (ribokinase family)
VRPAGRVLGVVGSLVWDTIHRHDEVPREAIQEWGGIGYALEALSASLPSEWTVRPLLKVGEDLAGEALEFLDRIPRTQIGGWIQVVRKPTTRVELHYRDGVRKGERLSGGPDPWRWSELEPRVQGCDALYVNFITGFEMELETATLLREHFRGPMYADLHSLFLGLGARGDRIPRPLPNWTRWLQAFDAVQMNESEFSLLAGKAGDPWALAARLVGPELPLMTVTLEDRGAAYVATAGFDPDPESWPRLRERMALPGPARSGLVSQEGGAREGDSTGCGDVWGATTFARLLAGDPLEEAMGRANRMAARNVEYRGARGLGHHLAGRLDSGEGL